MEVPYIEFH